MVEDLVPGHFVEEEPDDAAVWAGCGGDWLVEFCLVVGLTGESRDGQHGERPEHTESEEQDDEAESADSCGISSGGDQPSCCLLYTSRCV